MAKQIKSPSLINYNYCTIKITRSRLEYGLLAIPTSILNLFPKESNELLIYFDGSKILSKKSFVISEKNREARVYGLSEWYKKNKLVEDDEIVIQLLDRKDNVYGFITEKKFIDVNNKIQKKFDESSNGKKAESNLISLSEWNKTDLEQAALRELYRLSKEETQERKQRQRKNTKSKDAVPPQLRITLDQIYRGVCQVCEFWFLKKDMRPYFEIHHLDVSLGNHPKNLIIVCANCHRQFEFADVEKEYNDDGWLVEVFFNQNSFLVNQAILELNAKDFIKTTYS
ncbi:MAG: HNH endonuclease [Bacteroidetes bacterium]|nr:HNH endonuclease [Bacteroidota bacterium]